MSTPNIDAQRAYKAQEAFAKDNKAWLRPAMAAIKVWGSGDYTLPHAIALALQEAYRMGQRGEPMRDEIEKTPEKPAHSGTLLRRRR